MEILQFILFLSVVILYGKLLQNSREPSKLIISTPPGGFHGRKRKKRFRHR